MTRFTLIVLTTIYLQPLYGQKNYSGEYRTNFPTYGMFGQTLKLNCDSTVILNFQGDLMNDNSYGHWTVQNKILTIFFDTTKQNARYKDTLNFQIIGKRLYKIGLTKEMYLEFKSLLDKHNKETDKNLQIPNYNALNQTPKNFYGKTAVQYFKKSNSYLCE